MMPKQRRKQIAVSAKAEKLIGDFSDIAQAYGWSSDQGHSSDADADRRLLARRERRLRQYIADLELAHGVTSTGEVE